MIPKSLVPAAEPLVDRVVPLVKQYSRSRSPASSRRIRSPWCASMASPRLLGGVALATGKGRRLGALLLAGSLVPSTIAKHPFWKVQDPEERAQDRTHFLKNVSLLGGVLLACARHRGQAEPAWRAQKGGQIAGQGHPQGLQEAYQEHQQGG